MSSLRDAAMSSKAWPFEEARRVLKRYEKAPPEKGHVLFETGYGPSGLPHIGTFGEVPRTTMIRRAFEIISDIPTRLICFSDDLDGMRKVPDNVPQQEMLKENLQRPLTSVPDPFGEYRELRPPQQRDAAPVPRHVRIRIRVHQCDRFLQARAGSTRSCCAAASATTRSWRSCWRVLREERQQTYSCFLPIHPETGRVLYVPMKEVERQGRHDHLRRRGRRGNGRCRSPAASEAAVEAGFRRALGGARRRFRDVRQGPLHQHADL